MQEDTAPSAMALTLYPVTILDGITNEPVDAVVKLGVDESVAKAVDDVWQPNYRWLEIQINNLYPGENRAPQNSHWRWLGKMTHMQDYSDEYIFLALECQNNIQGMVCITFDEQCRIPEQEDEPLVYIDYISSAPWNLRRELAYLGLKPLYRAIGPAMIGTIITYSIERGFCGRIGLHSLPQAEDFYRRICKFTEFGKDPAHENLRYFEFTQEQAQAFLRGG